MTTNTMALAPDITFEGTTFVLVIDTDMYAGNFEREMAAYVVGAYDEERYHGSIEHDQFHAIEEFEGEESAPPQLLELSEHVITRHHDEYDEVSNTIWPTPGRINDGRGGYTDATEGQKGWAAYESVAVFLDVEPTIEQLAMIKERAIDYGVAHMTLTGKHEPIQIKNVYVLKIETQRTVVIAQSIIAL